MRRVLLFALFVAWSGLSSAAGQGQSTSAVDESATALLERANSLLAQDQYGPAREEFLEIRKLLQEDQQAELEIDVLIGLADIELKEGEYSAAGEWLDEAQILWERHPDPARGARLWTIRAGISFRQFRLERALQHRHRAVEQARAADDSALLFQTLTNLARAYLDLQDYAAAIPVFTEAATLEARPLDRVVNLIQLGISQFELNRFDEARDTFAAARQAAFEQGSPRLEGTALGELGLTAWMADGDGPAAIAYFDEAVDVMRSIGDRLNTAIWQSNKALVFRESGDYQAALDLYLALEIELESIEGQQVWPQIYKGSGQSQLALGLLEKAGVSIDKCLAAARSQGDRKRIWECQQLRGQLLARRGNLEEARLAYERALEEIEQVRVSLLIGRFKADFFENKLGVFQEYAELLANNLPAEEAAMESFAVAERARARSFLDEFAQTNVTGSSLDADAWLRQEEELLGRIRELREGLSENPGNAVEISRLESELDQLTLTVSAESGHSIEPTRPKALDVIQAALTDKQQILAYWLTEPRSFLWRIDSHSIELFLLPPSGEIESMVRQAYGSMSSPHRLPDLAALSQSLLGPVRDSGRLADSLLIIPSGILYFLPFEALPVSEGATLADHAETSYLPSASLVALGYRRVVSSSPPALLAVGGVSYVGEAGAERGLDPDRLAPLPYSEAEILAVRSAFGRFSTTLLRGDEARESRLKSLALDEYSVLHFATHGWIDAGSQSASGLVFAPGDEGEDGLWQSREIRQMSLNADLVTLSACQSGLGKLVTGEGMVGLTRAFLDAGVDTVIASLWNVNDQATADFMSIFYAQLARGASRAQALRQARIATRQKPAYAHPYYWAGWVLTGDGQRSVAFPPRWDNWLLSGLATALVLVLIFLLRRYSPS